LKRKGRYVPDIVMAGGFIEETQIYKSIALSNFGDGPFVKGVVMGRSPITAAMKSKHFVGLAKEGKLPKTFVDDYGANPERFFRCSAELGARYGEKVKKMPWEAVGVYSYLYDRIRVGLQQILAGSRKFKLDLINRNDLMALTERAARVTGIPMPHESEAELVEQILD